MVGNEHYILYLWWYIFYLYNRHSFPPECVALSALLVLFISTFFSLFSGSNKLHCISELG